MGRLRVEFVLTLSEGLLVAATWDLVKRLAREVGRRNREKGGPTDDPEVTEDRAVVSARCEVQLNRSGGTPDDLLLESVQTVDRNHFVVELRDEESGTAYEVVSQSVGAAVLVSRIRKSHIGRVVEHGPWAPLECAGVPLGLLGRLPARPLDPQIGAGLTWCSGLRAGSQNPAARRAWRARRGGQIGDKRCHLGIPPVRPTGGPVCVTTVRP